MKLVNFLNDKKFNELRNKMNAELIHWNGVSNWNAFDPFGFRASIREKGEVDIPFSEIKISSDGTLELYGHKILVYIRDQRYSWNTNYKFHIANCRTLVDAQKNYKYDKYVASINTNGIFKVNLIHGSWIEKDKSIKLKVCKNCLTHINYLNYRNGDHNKKLHIYNSFDLNTFFSLYKKQEIKKPKHTNITAPINNYTKDFKEISKNLKIKHNYTCESCNLDLSNDKRFLHVHHIDGIKSNNRESNLKVLCIGCHAEQHNHSHIKNLPDYFEFSMKYRNRLF